MFEKTFSSLKAIFRTREIRERLMFSFIVLVIFRVLATIPVVGIPADALKQLFADNSLGNILSTVSGGVLETASVVAIGLGPYINASVILQLLGSVIPKLEELRHEGSQGRRIISMYTRYLTVPLAVLQSFVIYSTLRGFGLVSTLEPLHLVAMIATLTGGAILMMWMGELIAESGLGNGSSYLIFLGIVAGLPNILSSNVRTADPVQIVEFTLIMVIIFAVVIAINQAERRVKLMYSRRVRATGTQESYIPVKITQFGVMPVIFAVSLLSFPQLIAQFLLSRDTSQRVAEIASSVLTALNNPWIIDGGTFLLVVLFSFFYVGVVFNTDELAENLQKQGAFIPGMRPGKQTSRYLRSVSYKLTAVGATFLGLLAILPNILVSTNLLSASIMSGTGLLILVGVVMDVKRQVESMVVTRGYDRYL